MTDQTSVQTQSFICGIYGCDECRRRTILFGELHYANNLFLTAENDLQVKLYVKIGRDVCKKEVCSFGIYICTHVAVI
jgi:hypothetical protein